MRNRTLSLILIALCAALPVAGAGKPGDLDQRLNLELAGAAASDVLNSFAAILQAEPRIDPAIDGLVTIQLNEVSARTTLNAICEMLDCVWKLEGEAPRRFVVEARTAEEAAVESPPGDLETPVTLSLLDAPVEEVFRSFASIGRWKLLLEKTTVTVELENLPVHAALDEICAQVDCVWKLDTEGDEEVLRIDWVE